MTKVNRRSNDMTDITRLKVCLCLVVMAVMPAAATGYELHYDADG